MANCNKLFLDFDKNLNIKKKKKEGLMNSKEVLRNKIRKYFKDNHPEYKPEFYIQGSYKMGTTILTKDDECDLDDGVYFKREIGVSGTTLQTWIKNAVEDATMTPPEHRSKCIRVIYQSDYHIDFPAYYFPKDKDHPFLAVKNKDLQESDPKEVVQWYFNQKDTNGQFHRTTKSLKAWGDFKRNKMPSGLAMSILAAENIQFDDRDDISLKDTLIKIQESLTKKFECIVPSTPYDDLFEGYDDARKNNFLSNLKDFIEDAKKACNDEPNQLKASKLWRKHMGDKFPFGADEDIDAKESALRKLSEKVLSGTAFTQKDGSISSSNGVKNKPHTNYGW
ncbi:cyclic GMP-AMP synthase DncV-like nucleotidyltransferase [Arenibacter sp. ARW7G5Y1]|uniref:CBASS cGAMP synthase n=1 Tax=Arenibacter sp. ARW7G5Y1 TaxID=2135619 RepID=UPI000D7651C2|nr:hypothetical protein [Arenibacter sp. ARW7G5Y1]PXX30397.1 hypothetical protein C7972_10220 [Arenibacter sp. ARW7G5Y1]